MGKLTTARIALCVKERGIEIQRIIIARSGLWPLVEFVAAVIAFC